MGGILGGIGKFVGGALGGPLGGLIGDKITSQLFGSKNRPSNTLAPQNPNYERLQNSALQQQQQGSDIALKYMGLLNTAIEDRANTIKAGYGNDAFGRMALGQAQAGADAAVNRARANLVRGLARRGGMGGGVLAGGLSNFEGQRAATMANAYNNVARERIAQNNAGQQELLQIYGNQQNLGNLLRQQADQQLFNLGDAESKRLAGGQQRAGEFFNDVGDWIGQLTQKTAPQNQETNPAAGGLQVNGYLGMTQPQYTQPGFLQPLQPINPVPSNPGLSVNGYLGMTQSRAPLKRKYGW